MPIVYKDEYGRRPRIDGKDGFEEITPTIRTFVEEDGTDVRLDRVRIFDGKGIFVSSYLRDKMGARFVDNLSNTEDDLGYLTSLRDREKK